MKNGEIWYCYKKMNSIAGSDFEIDEKVEITAFNITFPPNKMSFVRIKRIEVLNSIDLIEHNYFLKHFKKYYKENI